MKTPIQILDEMIEEYKFENDDVLRYGMNVLKKAKERIHKETGWIRVEDRLPVELLISVLVWTGSGIPQQATWDRLRGIFIRNIIRDREVKDVTHWTYLPKPPNN